VGAARDAATRAIVAVALRRERLQRDEITTEQAVALQHALQQRRAPVVAQLARPARLAAVGCPLVS